jgi:hypothetical protein
VLRVNGNLKHYHGKISKLEDIDESKAFQPELTLLSSLGCFFCNSGHESDKENSLFGHENYNFFNTSSFNCSVILFRRLLCLLRLAGTGGGVRVRQRGSLRGDEQPQWKKTLSQKRKPKSRKTGRKAKCPDFVE